AKEWTRHAALVARSRGCTMEHPCRVLCPRASLAQSMLDAVAREGGGFIHILDWDGLATLVEGALSLGMLPSPTDAERARSVERALSADMTIAASLKSDPNGVALAVLSVVDLLRRHGWDGNDPAPVTDAADSLLASHLAILATALRAVE